ncbi:MAG: proprotein convertase P-domain-containing protein [Chitinophagaceae bacterium]|nr:proprotein convertase P-domain-containing protein [Chitinophagaceae bacterium]
MENKFLHNSQTNSLFNSAYQATNKCFKQAAITEVSTQSDVLKNTSLLSKSIQMKYPTASIQQAQNLTGYSICTASNNNNLQMKNTKFTSFVFALLTTLLLFTGKSAMASPGNNIFIDASFPGAIPTANKMQFCQPDTFRMQVTNLTSNTLTDAHLYFNPFSRNPISGIIDSTWVKANTVKEFRFNSVERNMPIPDFNIATKNLPLSIIIPVSGLPKKANKEFGFKSLQLAIQHKFISDIKVELLSPNGTLVWITNRNGKDGGNYIETRFSQNGFKGHITQGKAPFLGEYIPDGELSNFNNNQNPNGNWILKVYDLRQGDSGEFKSVSLFFGSSPAVKAFSACSFDTPKGCKCSKNKNEGWLMPDLRIVEEFTLNNITEFSPSDVRSGRILFGVETVNLGLGPLEVVSENKWYCDSIEVKNSQPCPDGKYAKTNLIQVIYGLKNGKWQTQRHQAGTIAYDERPGHEHFHADEFVSYELLQKVDNESDVNKWKLISTGVKASFCIWDLSCCRDDIANCKIEKVYSAKNIPNYGLGGKYNACNEALQGLSVGGIDYYGENYEGQDITLPKGLKNGTYYLRLKVDPNNNYKESNETNNIIIIPIQLSKQEK